MGRKYLGAAPTDATHLSPKSYVDLKAPLVLAAAAALPNGTPDGTVVIREGVDGTLSHLEGTLANRPAASSVAIGTLYSTAGDTLDAGGCIYRSNGTAWIKWTHGINAAAGIELGYAELSSNGGGTATTATAIGLSVTVTVAAQPIIIKADFGAVLSTVANAGGVVYLMEGTTELRRKTFMGSPVANTIGNIAIERRLIPTAGSHTYSVAYSATSGNTFAIFGDGGNPVTLQVLTC